MHCSSQINFTPDSDKIFGWFLWDFCSIRQHSVKKKGNPEGERSLLIKKHTLQDFKAIENLTAGRLGGLAALHSACQ